MIRWTCRTLLCNFQMHVSVWGGLHLGQVLIAIKFSGPSGRSEWYSKVLYMFTEFIENKLQRFHVTLSLFPLHVNFITRLLSICRRQHNDIANIYYCDYIAFYTIYLLYQTKHFIPPVLHLGLKLLEGILCRQKFKHKMITSCFWTGALYIRLDLFPFISFVSDQNNSFAFG